MLRSFYREAAENWCHFAHAEPMWPVNGEYRCRTCLRTYPVPWANTTAGEGQSQPCGADSPVCAPTTLVGAPAARPASLPRHIRHAQLPERHATHQLRSPQQSQEHLCRQKRIAARRVPVVHRHPERLA